MSATSKILLTIAGLILLTGIVLFIPYPVPGVPEWTLHIVDINGREVAGARVQQEWMDPIDRNIVHADSRTADVSGKVVFPERRLHNRLALGTSRWIPVSKVIVCWAGRFGSVDWDGKGTPPSKVQLDLDGCAPRFTF
jgi:hypothetical protein